MSKHVVGYVKPAFTIIELLIVIVVIAVLAVIIVVSYLGIQQKAIIASLASDLRNAYSQLSMFSVDNNVYPATTNCSQVDSSTNKCLKFSTDTNLTYSPVSGNRAFCLTASKSGYSYNITQEGVLLAGPCPVILLDAGSRISYPGTGTTWYDLSGKGINGTMVNGVSFSQTAGGTMSFDGVDDRVNLGKPAAFIFGTNSFSYSVWIYSISSVGSWDMPFYNGGSSATNNGFGIELGTGIWVGGIADDTQYKTVTIGSETTGSWKHIFIVVDRTDNSLKGYMNGQLINTTNISGLGGINPANNSEIGGRTNITPNLFNGFINDFRVYDVAFSSSEVFQNFNTLKSRYGL